MLHGLRVKNLLPLAVSAVLLAVVLWLVSPATLHRAAVRLDWHLLVPLTAIMVAALYLWDALCLPVVYGADRRPITYGQSLHLRGLTYLAGSLNYELGQAGLAWGMARLQRVGLVRMLARSLLLAFHDVFVLLLAAGISSLASEDERVVRLRPYLAAGLAIAAAVAFVVWLLPRSVRARFRWGAPESFLEGWSIRRSARLLMLRTVYFGILVVYAVLAIRICHLPVEASVLITTIPIVLFADGLPSFAGIGTREATLLFLLRPLNEAQQATLVAMSLIWSTGMIFFRALIAIAHLWIHRSSAGVGVVFRADPMDVATIRGPKDAESGSGGRTAN